MKIKDKSFYRLNAFSNTFFRYPVSILFFLFLSLYVIRGNRLNYYSFHQGPIWAFTIGGVLTAVSQTLYEKLYLGKQFARIILHLIAILFTLAYYYFFLRHYPDFSWFIMMRFDALLAASIVAFIWIPTIKKSSLSFDLAFTVAFKSFFSSLLYSVILVIGFFIIFGTYTFLIAELDYVIFADLATIIFCLFAPICFLSYVPDYNLSEGNVSDQPDGPLTVPKLLRFLVSYIIIPLLTVYTLILMLYIVPNLAGEFWIDNLLEPLLISYAVIGFLTLFISHTFDTLSTKYFKSIFPKVFLVIASFQTLASIIKTQEVGLTPGRYYVILFGVFSIISSLLYSFSIRKKYLVPVLFIVLTTLSSIPPIDAVTVGLNSQIRSVESVLEKNNMLENDRVISNKNISTEDQKKIIEGLRYIEDYDALDRISWLPEDFAYYGDQFETVFGFDRFQSQYDEPSTVDGALNPPYTSLQLNTNRSTPLDISSSNQLVIIPFSYDQYVQPIIQTTPLQIEDISYNLLVTVEEDNFQIDLTTNRDENIISHNLSFMLEENYKFYDTIQDLPLTDLTFTEENDQAITTVIIENIEILDKESYSGSLYLLIDLKD
ncbi:hypothetical protein ACFP65_10080 [Marinilactibacillus sp. GCM10026970]|uniref:hypothetical protein n=1 Tax=Marinilactibacillus sp. GCM10026970 TaxID=3252642 RepID=UPI00360C3DDD